MTCAVCQCLLALSLHVRPRKGSSCTVATMHNVSSTPQPLLTNSLISTLVVAVTTVNETPRAAATKIQARWSSSETTAKGSCCPGGTICPSDDIVADDCKQRRDKVRLEDEERYESRA